MLPNPEPVTGLDNILAEPGITLLARSQNQFKELEGTRLGHDSGTTNVQGGGSFH